MKSFGNRIKKSQVKGWDHQFARGNEEEEKGWGQSNPTQREHSRTTRETSWCQSGVFYRGPEDGIKGESSGETSRDCISNQLEDGIHIDWD